MHTAVHEFCDGNSTEDAASRRTTHACAGHAVRRLQSLCTGRYDALYVQRYRQTTGKCEF